MTVCNPEIQSKNCLDARQILNVVISLSTPVYYFTKRKKYDRI